MRAILRSMSEMLPPGQDPDAEAVGRPTTSPAELARIAGQRPDLHPAIAAHPSCYPGLAAWITAQGGPSQPPSTGSQQPARPSAGPAPQLNRAVPQQQPEQSSTSTRQPAPQSSSQQQETPPDTPPGVRRRSVVKAFPIGIGATAVGALAGAGARWATRRADTSNSASTASGPFSLVALDGEFLQGTHETWSIPECDFDNLNVSPDGNYVAVFHLNISDRDTKVQIYPINADALGDPVVFSKDKNHSRKNDDNNSVIFSWWGERLLLQDVIYDSSASTQLPVPWDPNSNTFLGTLDKSTAALIEVPHVLQEDSFPIPPGAQGPIVAVDQQGQELWRTAESYTTGFLDPARPDLLIGYQKDSADDDPKSFSVVPHLLDPKTGAVRAPLPFGMVILASDGLVCLPGGSDAAEAYTFDGQAAWKLTGAFDRLAFCGIPTLDVAHQALTSRDGSTALVAENGTALIQAADGSFSREDTGTAVRLGNYHADTVRLDDLQYFTVLADGSGVLTYSLKDTKNPEIRMIDTGSGTEAWSLPSYLLTGIPPNQGRRPVFSAGTWITNGSRPAESMCVATGSLFSPQTITCLAPGP